MLTDIAPPMPRGRPQRADLKERIEAYVRQAAVRVTRIERNRATITVPGHSTITWPEKASSRREDAATLLLSFLLDEFAPEVFFDIGAAIGFFSRVAASRLVTPPQVHAFEMRPTQLDIMRHWIAIENPRPDVHVHQMALSDQNEGERDVWFVRTRLFDREPQEHEHREAWWRRVKFYLRGIDRSPVKETITVTSIDHFVMTNDCVPGLLKIDVDGFEGKVIRGGLEVFARHKPPIMLELHKSGLMRFGERRTEVVAMLLDIGYRALFLTDHHNAKECRLIEVSYDHPLLRRQETDFVLFC